MTTLTRDAFITKLESHARVDDPVWRASVVAKIQSEDFARHHETMAEIERASLSQLRDPKWRREHGLRPRSMVSAPTPRGRDASWRAGFAAENAGKRPTRAQIDNPRWRDGFCAAVAERLHLEPRQKAITGAGAASTRVRALMPRENLYRGLMHFRVARSGRVTELRSVSGDSNVLEGHFAVFNEWTEIDSMWEGNFLEQIAPGAFKKTFRESAQSIRALFQHGRDPQIGDKPLGAVDTLEEDTVGAHYVVPLFETSYNADLVPGLRAGVYGASFRFSVIQESVDNEPAKSAMNPNGIPQRTITEARVFEFGPVTFPAYASATAGVRSLSDEFRQAA